MSYLDDLNRKLSSLQGQKSNIETQIRNYSKRKTEVEKLIRDLANISDNQYSNVNKYADKIVGQLPSALTKFASVDNIGEAVSSQKEKSSSNDGNISTALEYLRLEINNINSKLDSLYTQLNSVNQGINDTNNSITQEKRRIEEERRRQEEERRRQEEERRRRDEENRRRDEERRREAEAKSSQTNAKRR